MLNAEQHWGMTATVLHSSSQLSAALKEGHHVLPAVQQDKFSPWGFGTSHEIVLKGYSMEILTFMTHIMQQTTVGILSNGFGENKVPNQVISMV